MADRAMNFPGDSPQLEAVTAELNRPLSVSRNLFSIGMTALAFLLTGLALLPLLSVLFKILSEGLPQLSLQLLTAGITDTPSGFANAVVGTLTMVGIASLISIPIGVLAAIYLSEFGKNSPIARTVRFVVTILSGVPSIVVGVFAYGVLVISDAWVIGDFVLKPKGFSALAGGFALAIVMLPIVVLATEEALKLVPTSQRLASASLGANHFQTTFRVVVVAALPGITTGVLLAVARASGETAPLLFTALFNQNWPDSLTSPTASLSVLIYNYATSAFVEQNQLAWSASVILVGIVLTVSVLSRIATQKRLKVR